MKRKLSIDVGWKVILRELQVSPEHVLRRAMLPEDCLNHADFLLTVEEYFRFWKSIEQEVNNPLFPLTIVTRSTPETFSPIMLTALCSANLMQAGQRMAKYKHMMQPTSLDIEVAANGDMTLTPRWLESQIEVPASLAYTEMAFFIHLARLGTRKPVNALRVVLPKFPHPQTLKQYEIYFGVTPEVGITHSITFMAEDVLRPFLTANDAICKAFEPELQRRLLEADMNSAMHERVKSLLIELMPSNKASIEAVSLRLAVSKRSLQRSLNSEGISFRDLLNQTRENLARHYLENTSKSGAEISQLLGFEDPNSFYRAFQNWTGKRPESLRNI